MSTRGRKTATLVVVIGLALAGCGSDDDDAEPTTAAGAAEVDDSGSDSAADGDADDSGPSDGSTASATSEIPETEVLDLTLGVFPGAWPNINDFVAQEVGIFERHGLNVDMVDLATGPDQITAVASGSIDIASNAPANFMIPNSRGQDLVGIVNVINAPLYSWVAQGDWPTPNADTPYPGPVEDFRGANIGITGLGAEVHLFTQALLRDAGLSDDDVTFVPVGGVATGVAAFEAGQTDIHVAFEPAQTLLTSQFDGRILVDLRAGEGPEIFSQVSGQIRGALRTSVESDPEKFIRYQAATEEVIEFIRDPANIDAVVEAFRVYSSLDDELARSLIESNRETLSPLYSCTGHEALAQFEVDVQQIPEGDTQDCDEFFWSGAERFLAS